MTVVEEIKQTMRRGSNAMFFMGLLAMYDKNSAQVVKDIEQAAEEVRIEREVMVKPRIKRVYRKRDERRQELCNLLSL